MAAWATGSGIHRGRAMRHALVACVCALGVTLSARAAPPAARALEPAPTTDAIYASFEDADYPKVLRQIAAALATKGDAAEAYDRHELLVLRGETQLRMKNFAAAAAAFDEAAKETKLEEKAAVARATAELLRRSKKGAYTPPAKQGMPESKPLDVTDPAARRQAFAAMFDESRPRVEAAARSAWQSEKVPAMLDAFALLRDLRALEIAATGESPESAATARDLGGRFRTLFERAVLRMGKTVTALETSASAETQEVASVGGRMVRVGSGPNGLEFEQAELLRQIAIDCDRVRTLAGELRSLYEGGDEVAALKKLSDDAAAVADGARQLLGVNWREYYRPEAYVAPGAASAEGVWNTDGPPTGGPRRGGTTSVQRPAPKGNPAAGPRGVGTGGRR